MLRSATRLRGWAKVLRVIPSLSLLTGAIGVLGVVSWQACSDSTGPGGDGQRVAVGDTISDQLAASDTLRLYTFNASADAYYAVFFHVVSGDALVLKAGYSAFETLGTALSAPGHALRQDATEVFWTRATGSVEIRVTKAGGTREGAFRFVVHRVNRLPEARPNQLTLGDTIGGERLETIADVDEYTIAGQADQTVIALLHAEGLSSSGTIRLVVIGTETVGSVTSHSGDSILGEQVSGAFVLPTTRDYRVVVVSVRDHTAYAQNYEGSYRFALVPLQPSPERIPAEIAIGDTVGEDIYPVGDIDEFRFTGSVGQELNVFFQALSGRASDLLYLDVPVLVGGYPASLQSAGTDTSLFGKAVGRFTVPSPGPHAIRIRGANGGPGGDRGLYRFHVYAIDRRPEHAGAQVTLGDTVSDFIEAPGDIDEYALLGLDQRLANILLWSDPVGSGGGLDLGVDSPGTCSAPHRAATSARTRAAAPTFDPAESHGAHGVPAELAHATGTFPLGAGTHVMIICGGSFGGGYYGGYRVETFSIDSLPESRSDTIAIGDTVDTEAIGQPGDIDRFVFRGKRGQHIDVYLQGQAQPSAGEFYVDVGGADSNFTITSVGTSTWAPTLDGQRSYRIDLPVTAWYRLLALPAQNGRNPSERGGYRFAVLSVPGNPETASPDLVPGDSVTTERLEDVYDVDEYVLTGAPNQELAAFLFSGETRALTVAVYDTATGDIVDAGLSVVALETTGRFLLPGTGVLGVRVYSPRPCPPEIMSYCSTASGPGTYFLQVLPIDRAPENAPAVVALEDTVTEAIDPRPDVDEYTFSGTIGDVITVLFDTPSGVDGQGFVLDVIDPTNGDVLGSAVSKNPSVTFGEVATGNITLPRTGAYLVRVQGISDRESEGPYRFLIKLGA